MKKYLLFLSSIIIFLLMLQPVKADTGPKPYLEIKIDDLEKSNYYFGLIVFSEYNGPHIGINQDNIDKLDYLNEIEKQRIMVLYSKISLQEDEYLFDRVYYGEDITSASIRVGYYPPKAFKLVVYDEINEKLVTSLEYNLYAFGTYYYVNFSNSLINDFKLFNNYNYGKEIGLLLIRIIITLVIEVGLGLLYKFDRKSIIRISIINIITQFILNIGLNYVTYYQGRNILLIIYSFPLLILFELIICFIEMFFYKKLCNRKDKGKKGIVLYTLFANLLSFGFGFLLWLFL
ncbi:MAG: hypothetical protein ACI35S_01820 [Anaeroplasma sp.]